MKTKDFVTVNALILLLTSSTIALAGDKLPEKSMPMSQILQSIQKQGFGTIVDIEYDDGVYSAKAINYRGDNTSLEVAPLSGEIIKPKAEDRDQISIFDAAKKVEAAGYHNIYEMKTSKSKYEVKAYDSNDKKVSLDVDVKSGTIKK